MHKINYEIKLNTLGRPCIELSKDYEDKPEDKFLAIELTKYVLHNVYERRSAEFDEEAAKVIDSGIRLLGQVGDEMAEILWNNMKCLGDSAIILGRHYHIMVETIEERDNLSNIGIIQEDKIYIKQEGLKVLVRSEDKIYILKDGITNDNWFEIL